MTLDVTVDGLSVTSYLCDGLIVATAAGSTGHALSAGGPILAPGVRGLVLCPICPHTLGSRPLVVTDDSSIVIRGMGETPLLLAADGQVGMRLESGDVVTVARGSYDVRMIRLPAYDYYAVLRQKLHWRGSTR